MKIQNHRSKYMDWPRTPIEWPGLARTRISNTSECYLLPKGYARALTSEPINGPVNKNRQKKPIG